ncbi:hypothetical protein RX790_28180, partial [Pseudomonas syringae pv. actinidiae]|nr:hypothetical protein [Pseudomonas syringae pv. actinidiae]
SSMTMLELAWRWCHLSAMSVVKYPPVSFDHYFGSENQRNRTEVLFHYSMQNFSGDIGLV